ncbi:MAG: BlaI/MecI/CopY family transcriptional regulator [Verrucomicrobia bacterium]|nr:BlaI/MecI/CopY family transcriptional regulator [Verrucomicrobiota bacterium]
MALKHHRLSRRERQILDIVYAKSEASAFDVQEALPDPPHYSTVRTLLAILERKGFLKHTERGQRYFYQPTEAREKVRPSALKRVVETFFGGSLASAVAALVDDAGGKLPADELERLETIIQKTKPK